MSKVISLEDEAQWESVVLKNEKPVLVKFGA